MEKKGTILGLDVSTKTIGIALFNTDGKLLELTHITPRPKPKPETKVGELIKKANIFKEFIQKYKKLNVIKVIREVTALGLKEAKDLADGAPSVVKEAVPTDEANEVKAKLEEAGATVTLK